MSPKVENAKYTVDYSEENLVAIYIDKWVLNWCKKNHPEVFVKAEELIRKQLNKEEVTGA